MTDDVQKRELRMIVMCTGTISGRQCPYPAAGRYRCPHGGQVNLLCEGHLRAHETSTTYGACATCGAKGFMHDLFAKHYIVER